MGEQLYFPIWKKHLADILDLSDYFSSSSSLALSANDFRALGNRKDYTFNLVLENGVAVNDISGSAVARDLASMIFLEDKVIERLQGKRIKINMDSNFTLHIQNQSV
ncbi:MAG: hypothetical protein V4594_21845 [Bacteroidota bacterium]